MGLPEEKTTNVAQRIQQKFRQSCGAKDEKLELGEAKIQQEINDEALSSYMPGFTHMAIADP